LRYFFESFSIDAERRELRRDEAAVPVEPKVLDLLLYLVGNRDRVVSRDDLIGAIWDGRIVSESAIATCINAARAALADSGDEQRLIKTFPRKGLRFVGAVREDAKEPAASMVVLHQAPLALPDWPSVAILPFQNMSSDPEQEYFADGIVDDIIAGLARIKWLFVISRNSSFVYKNRPTDVKQVGRELGVRYVLEGSVRKAGQRVRVSTQLVDAESGSHIWVERYDRQLDDIFALQDDISDNVIGAIEPSLREAEVTRARRRRPGNLEAYDLVLRAQPFAHSHIAEDAAIAIPLLQRALTIEPDYASAHAPLALCHHSRFSRAGLREEDRLSAIRHAHAAVACGADDAAALGIAGFVIALDEHDRRTALRVFDQALALSNSNFFALCSSALALSWMGTADIAVDRAQRALRLSPFDPLNYLSYNALAIAYLHTRAFAQAHEVAARSVELNPRFSVSRAFLTAALSRLGRHEEAAGEARQLLDIDPGFSIRRFSVTVDIEPLVFTPIAEAWQQAGLPAG
jgi:TolB-like protein/tetratricopeptide (TPR) repeat protein